MTMRTHALQLMSTHLLHNLMYFKISGNYTLMMVDYQVRFSYLNSTSKPACF